MRAFRTLVALAAALTATGLFGSPAQAADGDVAWTVRTASNSFGADRSSFSYAVNPGGKVDDTMVVANHGKTALDLAVYAADGFTTQTGQLDLLTRDKQSKAIGVWLRAGGEQVTVQPGKSVDVPFTVAVPDNATPGDYVGGVVTSLTQPDQEQGINVERRLGIRVKLRVGGELTPQLTIENLHVAYAGPGNPFGKGDATVTYTIHNTGNAIESAQQAVSLSGPFGWLKASASSVQPTPELLPGESWTVTVPVHGVAPAVRLAATATLTPLVTDASGSTTALDTIAATAHGWAVPWTLVLFVVVLIAVVVAIVVLTRRGRAQRKAREDARVQEAVKQAIRAKEAQTS
ncbi:hypothetical protein Ais01nite_77570 [Asanoa ishikariensis]|uniref:C5a peptidase/Subtilisin-like protease SBT2-like Fn3-like domain-containing protein n=1 Tax=Asanoa ishikariensis TaxID=137265 RepID=A0A1H3KSE3_9ACTN|nr:DUF916 domain-containing protein [Asanoa ishikariensis]GIF69722.1 hypothetical protein Ais01nite_77570 [Asanoa ishikariensis]SDY55031.1 protein of unknown function [Asanoa ishikariensis]